MVRVSPVKTTADKAIATLPQDFHLITDKHEIREAFLPAYNMVANSPLDCQEAFVDYLLSDNRFSRQVLSLCSSSAGNRPFARQILSNPKASTEMVETLLLTRVSTLGYGFEDIELLLNRGGLNKRSTVVALIASVHVSQLEQLLDKYPLFEFYSKKWSIAELAEVYNKVMWTKMSETGKIDIEYRTRVWSIFHYASAKSNTSVPIVDAFIAVAQKIETELPYSWVKHLFLNLVDSDYLWKDSQ